MALNERCPSQCALLMPAPAAAAQETRNEVGLEGGVSTGMPMVVFSTRAPPIGTTLIESKYGGPRFEPGLLKRRLLDRTDPVLPLLDISRLEHQLIVGKLEMAVEQGDAEPIQVPVLCQHEADFF